MQERTRTEYGMQSTDKDGHVPPCSSALNWGGCRTTLLNLRRLLCRKLRTAGSRGLLKEILLKNPGKTGSYNVGMLKKYMLQGMLRYAMHMLRTNCT